MPYSGGNSLLSCSSACFSFCNTVDVCAWKYTCVLKSDCIKCHSGDQYLLSVWLPYKICWVYRHDIFLTASPMNIIQILKGKLGCLLYMHHCLTNNTTGIAGWIRTSTSPERHCTGITDYNLVTSCKIRKDCNFSCVGQ